MNFLIVKSSKCVKELFPHLEEINFLIAKSRD